MNHIQQGGLPNLSWISEISKCIQASRVKRLKIELFWESQESYYFDIHEKMLEALKNAK